MLIPGIEPGTSCFVDKVTTEPLNCTIHLAQRKTLWHLPLWVLDGDLRVAPWAKYSIYCISYHAY